MAGVYKQVGMEIKQQRKWHRHSLDKLSWANTGLRFTARGLLRFCSHTLFSTTIISLKEQIAHKSQSSHVEQTWCGPKKKNAQKPQRTSQTCGAISSALKKNEHRGTIGPCTPLISSCGNDVIFCRAIWRGVYLRGVGHCNGGSGPASKFNTVSRPKMAFKAANLCTCAPGLWAEM